LGLGTKGSSWKLDGNKRIVMGLLLGTRGIWCKVFGNLMRTNKILMGYWWEQEEFDGNSLGTWWEFNPPPLRKDKKTSLGGILAPPNWLSHMFYAKVFFRDKLLR
jgi:hypothetical protein